MGLLAMRMVLLGLLGLLLVLLLVWILLVRILPRTHLDSCDARIVEKLVICR